MSSRDQPERIGLPGQRLNSECLYSWKYSERISNPQPDNLDGKGVDWMLFEDPFYILCSLVMFKDKNIVIEILIL